MKNLNNRAQLTVFIILAMLILIVVGTLVWAGVRVSNTNQFAQQDNRARTSAVHAYLESCLERVALDTIALWAGQGGRLYVDQGGQDPLPDQFIRFEGKTIPYLILPPEGAVGSVYSAAPPEYPWRGFPFLTTGQPWLYGYYGRSMLLPLYDNFSFSAQHNFEQAIEFGMRAQCKNLAAITRMPTLLDSVRVFVTLAQDPLFVLDTLSLAQEHSIISASVHVKSADEQNTVVDWQDTISFAQSVRIVKLYHVIKNLIEQDTTRIDFNIQGIQSGGYVVTVLPQGADDLIMVRDERTRINGRALEFLFGRKNRLPALYELPKTLSVGCIGTSITYDATTATLWIAPPVQQTGCGQNTSLSLKALDPDEEKVTYAFVPLLPHIITSDEVSANKDLPLTVFVKDSANMTDWQSIQIPLRRT